MQLHPIVKILWTAVVIELLCGAGIFSQNNECGEWRIDPAIDIEFGVVSGIFPWHVVVYERNSTGSFREICGGTLISENVVVSAAQCFHDEITVRMKEASSFIVAAGKNYRPYDWPEEHLQKSGVKSIHVPSTFLGIYNGYAGDIAWLVLQESLDLTTFSVKPACIDLEHEHEREELQEGRIGEVVGWGPVSIGIPGNKSRVISVTFIPLEKCTLWDSKTWRPFVTSDKFCASYPNVSGSFGPCQGDIGGGLFFFRNDRWYIRGIINVAESLDANGCGSSPTTAFMNFGKFTDEIKTNVALNGVKKYSQINVCGLSTIPRSDTLIAGGVNATHGGFPWHVGIYRKNTTGFHEQICAGSLVSENLVISAAHCFYDDTIGQKMDAKRFAVAAGKLYRPFNWLERYVQKSAVQTIHLPNRYHGIGGLYAADIAWLILEHPFRLSSFVSLICLEFNNRQRTEDLLIGQVGKVAGWGLTEDNSPSFVLQQTDFPFIPYEECTSKLSGDYKPYVTIDKFCAGYLNGTTLCEGDSGGGLAFKHDGRWYLRGIVSVNPRGKLKCGAHSYTAFTNVELFTNELRKLINLRI